MTAQQPKEPKKDFADMWIDAIDKMAAQSRTPPAQQPHPLAKDLKAIEDFIYSSMNHTPEWERAEQAYQNILSRPHPAPAHKGLTGCFDIGCDCPSCQESKREWLKPFEERAARQAREDMLNLIRKTDAGGCPHTDCKRGEGHDGLNCRDCLIHWIEEESLRGDHK